MTFAGKLWRGFKVVEMVKVCGFGFAQLASLYDLCGSGQALMQKLHSFPGSYSTDLQVTYAPLTAINHCSWSSLQHTIYPVLFNMRLSSGDFMAAEMAQQEEANRKQCTMAVKANVVQLQNFSSEMSKVLSHLPVVLVYFDGILVFSRSEEEHVGHLQQVLALLRKTNLYAKKSQCFFFTK